MRIKTLKATAALAALAMSFATASFAMEPNDYYTDWTEYYYNAGVDAHFYYSPMSIYRIGELRQVEWTDSKDKGAEKIVFIVHIDCTKRTIQSRVAKRYRAADNVFIGAVDLTGQAPTEQITPGTMADRLVTAVC